MFEEENPSNLAEVKELLPVYKDHYNNERPHQGQACKNVPPMKAFPQLPVLPGLPLLVDPDRWVRECNGMGFVRKVDFRGTIKVDKHRYYLSGELKGKYVLVEIDGEGRELVIRADKTATASSNLKELKRVAIKGLYNQEMTFDDYLNVLLKEARSERRLALLKTRYKKSDLAA